MDSCSITSENHQFNKLKGCPKKKISKEILEKINEGQIVRENLNTIMCNKKIYINESWNLEPIHFERKFKKIYTKGIISKEGIVTPLII